MRQCFRSLAHGLRSITPNRARGAIARVGQFFSQSSELRHPSVEGALHYLRDWGFRPSTAIDIGAYHGEWTRLFKGVYPECRILMIEAQEKESQILKNVCDAFDGDVYYTIALLGAEDGGLVRFVEMETGSSVFEESSPYRREYAERKLISLDTLVRCYPVFTSADFLKLDVQGYELEVLRGAARLLESTELVLLEASLIPVNRGCPLIDDVVLFMRNSGFRLLDFCSQIRRKDCALWQTDLLFLRKDSAFMPKPFLDAMNWA